MAAVLAVTTTLAAGLTVLPSSVQEAQANPCSLAAGAVPTAATGGDVDGDNEQVLDCEFTGAVIDEGE